MISVYHDLYTADHNVDVGLQDVLLISLNVGISPEKLCNYVFRM